MSTDEKRVFPEYWSDANIAEVHAYAEKCIRDYDGTTDETLPLACSLVSATEQLRKRASQLSALREALRDARGEITRMATDGGGFSCAVIDDIDAALASTEPGGEGKP